MGNQKIEYRWPANDLATRLEWIEFAKRRIGALFDEKCCQDDGMYVHDLEMVKILMEERLNDFCFAYLDKWGEDRKYITLWVDDKLQLAHPITHELNGVWRELKMH